MKIHREFDQNSLDWCVFRAGKITASEADALISPTFKRRKSEGVETYLALKAAELWLGGPLAGHGTSFDMDQGKILENEAIPALRFEHEMSIERVGFITGTSDRIGCSPDGVVMKQDVLDYGVEIKCPQPKAHVGYLLNNEVPDEYKVQVAFSMFVTGADRWFFVSYHRRFPTLILEVERNSAHMTEIYFAVEEFLPRVDEAIKRLAELNGGLPDHFTKQPQPEKSEEYVDIIP